MAEKLTYQQRLAVENRGGKLLVSAAAGSGKTKVLVDRLMGYLLDPVQPANIDDFLIITYTKAAAAELRGKIAAKLSEKIAEMPENKHLRQQMQRLYLANISTVHGFCTDILRQYSYRLDIPADFRVADEGECVELQHKAMETVLNNAYESASDNPDFYALIDTQGLGRDDRQIPEIVLKVYTAARCHLNPQQWLQWCTNTDFAIYDDAGQTPWGQYLIADLKHYVSLQIDAFQRCIVACKDVDGMEKPAALFAQTVAQLQQICDCKTWDKILAYKSVDFGRLTFSKNCSDSALAEQMKAVRNGCKDGLAKRLRSFTDSSEQIFADLQSSSAALKGLLGLVSDFTAAYDRIKGMRSIFDFSDLEHKTLDLLLGKSRNAVTAIAAEIGERFREVMVDEYQDSNEIQDAIFSALTAKKQNCFMVGDVKQSIYQFRLADPEIFIEKYNTYASAENATEGEGRRVLLSHNFRSSAGVISAVNDVFSLCMSPNVGGLVYGVNERLQEGIPHVALNEREVSLYGIDVQSDTYEEESAFVADRICELLNGKHMVREGDILRPVRPEDIVILLRSPSSVGAQFQYALQEKGIRCVTGGTADLLQTEEISTVQSIMQVIDNPLQDIPMVAALTSRVFGFTAEDLAKLRSKDKHKGIYELLCESADNKCIDFLTVLNKLRNLSRISTVTELLSAIYTNVGIIGAYSAMADGDTRTENLQSFFQIVADYESTGPKDLHRLLEHLDAAKDRGLTGSVNQQEKGAVTIMSIHKSKGLEFPVVFLCGLSRGFNQESARGQLLCDKDLGIGLGCVDTKLRVRYPTIAKKAISTKILRDGISEELRVLYVAMTRARDRLIMTYAVKNLSANLQELAMRLDMCSPELLSCEVDCPGAWILQTALHRTEAGAFFALGGTPNCANVSEIPWHIAVADTLTSQAGVVDAEPMVSEISKEAIEKFSAGLTFRYQNTVATQIPSKLTATQLKGRSLDTEIAEGTDTVSVNEFRKPSPRVHSGIEFGNAIHTAMEYLDFSACCGEDTIKADIDRLVADGRLSAEQAQMVDCTKITTFFQTPVGVALRTKQNVLREFKFSILEDATKYYPGANGEKILMQGVVDCAIIDDDGITIIDFKTDHVSEDTLEMVSNKYRSQVNAYSDALSRIYQKPVKAALLYFFAINRFVDVI